MSTKRRTIERLYDVLESYERLFQFRDPNNACLFDLRVNECYALELIVERAPMSVMDISRGLGVHKSNASRIASALEEKGLVAAENDEFDRRSVRFRATPKGIKKYKSVRGYLIERFERVLRSFNVEHISIVAEVLEALTSDAEERMRELTCADASD